MLTLLGRRYVVDHAAAFFRERQKKEVFCVYVTDALKVMTENTARFAGGSTINARYYDIIHPKPMQSAGAVREKIKAKFRR